jgi:hypothetical protein
MGEVADDTESGRRRLVTIDPTGLRDPPTFTHCCTEDARKAAPEMPVTSASDSARARIE